MVSEQPPQSLPRHGRRRYWPEHTEWALWATLLLGLVTVYCAGVYLFHTIQHQRWPFMVELVWLLLFGAATAYAYRNFTRQHKLDFDYTVRSITVCHWRGLAWQATHTFSLNQFQTLILREHGQYCDITLLSRHGNAHLLAERLPQAHHHRALKRIRQLQKLSGLPYGQQHLDENMVVINAIPPTAQPSILQWMENRIAQTEAEAQNPDNQSHHFTSLFCLGIAAYAGLNYLYTFTPAIHAAVLQTVVFGYALLEFMARKVFTVAQFKTINLLIGIATSLLLGMMFISGILALRSLSNM